ncbi:MAG: Lrp/AsnC family transcriptional regulator [Chloroflexota bacterium]
MIKHLDKTSQHILKLLQENGRATYASIAEQVGLSTPAVKERMLKMEDAGIITGYTVQINKEALGYSIGAFLLVDVPYERDQAFAQFAKTHESISECYHILGNRAFILRIHMKEMSELEALIQQCLKYGQPTTYMLLSEIKGPEIG